MAIPETQPAATVTTAPPAVRPATPADLRGIVQTHQAAFPGFFLTEMGPAFLNEYYRLVLHYPRGILLVTEQDESITGFVAGFVSPDEFYQLMKARRWSLAFPILAGILRNPGLLRRLFANIKRVNSQEDDNSTERFAELSSLATHPDAQGRGIGRTLVEAFSAAADQLGADTVMLTTDAENNEAVNIFYRKCGFSLVKTFLAAQDRAMNEYRLPLNTKAGAR